MANRSNRIIQSSVACGRMRTIYVNNLIAFTIKKMLEFPDSSTGYIRIGSVTSRYDGGVGGGGGGGTANTAHTNQATNIVRFSDSYSVYQS